MTPSLSRILPDRDAAAAWSAAQRAAGLRVVFTNGVFDLIHPGHLDSLRRARAEGDVLIVGINDDESVRRLKGVGRPVLPIGQRLRLMVALEMVDAAVAFGEDTPGDLIRAIAPDVLVKGGHYAIPEIVGHDFVLERGGRVLSLPLLPGRSTTGTIDRIKARFLHAPAEPA